MSLTRSALLAGIASVALPACPLAGDSFETDRCADPSAATIESLELGPGQGQGFSPWQDGDLVSFEYGPQGGTMLALRYRAWGAPAGCMMVTTLVSDASGRRLAESAVPLRFYRQSDGSYLTDTHWPVLWSRAPRAGTMLLVEATVAGAAPATAALWLEEPYTGPGLAALEPAQRSLTPGESASMEVTLTDPAVEAAWIAVFTPEEAWGVSPRLEHTAIAPGRMTGSIDLRAYEYAQIGDTVEIVALLGDQALVGTVNVVAP